MQTGPDEDLDRAGGGRGGAYADQPPQEGRHPSADPGGAWAAITGWLEDGGVGDIDSVVYGTRPEP